MQHPAPKILIVDDSASNRLVFRRVLAGLNVDVLEATNGAEALDIAEHEDLLLVLLDVQMPGMTGFDVARGMRELERNRETPIIFVTAAYTDPQHLRHGYTLGAIDYLVSKPIDEEFLRQKVDVYLRIFRQRRELESLIARVKQENQALYYENEMFREQHEDMLRNATHDALTDLPNRMLFQDRLKAAIHRASRSRTNFALMFIDLDNLKEVNDLHGHAAGDELLAHVAQRLLGSVRASDTVARLGGDEFGLVLENLDSTALALALGQKVLAHLSESLILSATLSGEAVRMTPEASIGIALFPEHGRTREELLMLADLAMYQVKTRGGAAVQVYERGSPGHRSIAAR